jgi:hypothetical protein
VLNRGEAVNALKRAIYTGRISPAQAKRVDEMQCWRHLNSDPPCRSNIDPGRIAEFGISNCG